MNPVRDDAATAVCQACGQAFVPTGRRRWCSTTCRQAGWRRRHTAPVAPLPAKPNTVYECDRCGARYLGEQRCDDCNTFCRRLGPGGPCPHCDEPVVITDIVDTHQLVGRLKK